MLLSYCDGAVSQDGKGYNKYDSIKARRILSQKETIFRARSLGKILLKYRRQIDVEEVKQSLDMVEVQIKKIPVPKNVAVVNRDEVTFFTPYNEDFIWIVKEHKGRWNPNNKTWNVPHKYAKEVYEEGVRIYGIMDVIGDIPNPEDVPFGEVFYDEKEDRFSFTTEYSQDFVDDIKILGGQWNPDNKKWTITVTTNESIKGLIKIIQGYNIEPVNGAVETLLKMEDDLKESIEKSSAASTDFEVPVPEGLELYPYQKAGIEYIEKKNGRALLGDEMGLGKSPSFLCYLNLHPEIKKTLIVCPAFLKTNWKREAEKWLIDRTVGIIDGKKQNWDNDVVIMNYDIIKKHQDKILEQNFGVMCLDEVHYVKNIKAQRTQVIMKISDAIPKVVALSGTPILNRPIEAFTPIRVINPSLFPSFKKFAERYTNSKWNGFGYTNEGARNQEELGKILRSKIMVRRLKKDVLTELPEKIRNTVYLEPKSLRDYNLAMDNFVQWLRDNVDAPNKISKTLKAEVLTKINILRKLVGEAKIDETIKWLTELIDSSSEKTVVFTVHREVGRRIAEGVKGLHFDGSVPAQKRQQIVDNFDTDPNERVLVTTIGAGGVGLNLQTAENVIIVELPWRPSDVTQAEDRVHRIGQTGQVMSYTMIVDGTIDDHMCELLNTKDKIVREIMDGETTEQISILGELIGRIIRSPK